MEKQKFLEDIMFDLQAGRYVSADRWKSLNCILSESKSDLLDIFNKMLSDAENPSAGVELEERFDCDRHFHKWKLYHGFREKYNYCELCDVKDTSSP